MPRLIHHIDAIARQKQRDVLFVTFTPVNYDRFGISGDSHYDYEDDPKREEVCTWLTEHHIGWEPCGHIASENLMCSYEGQIYVDVPFDDDDQAYQLVRDYLEHPDGSMRTESVVFWCLTLERAMKNAHHDEPGFWERWAETF